MTAAPQLADAAWVRGAPPALDRVRIGFAAVIASAIITLVSINHSLEWGRLSFLPAYDDLIYLISALRIHDLMLRVGLGAWLAAAIDPFHHSPPFSALGAIGYAVFGRHDFAPYAAMALPLGALLFLMASRLRAFQGDAIATGIFIALTFTPLLQFLIAEFRPDFTWGLFVAYGSFRLYCDWLEAPEIQWDAPRCPWQASLAYAIGVIIKPKALIGSTLLLIGLCAIVIAAALVGTMINRRSRQPAIPPLRNAIITTGKFVSLCVLICLPLLWKQLPYIYSYTIDIAITNRAAWIVSLPVRVMLLYYLSLAATTLASSLPVIVVVALAALWSSLGGRRNAFALAGVAAIIIMQYVSATGPENKNLYFGAAFFAGLMWSPVFLYPFVREALAIRTRYRAEWRNTRSLRAISLIIGVLLVCSALPYRALDVSIVKSRQSQYDLLLDKNRRAVAAAALQIIEGIGGPNQLFPSARPVLTIYSNTIGPFDPDIIRYLALKRGLALPAFTGNFMSRDFNAQLAEAERADLAVLPESDAHGIIKQFVGHEITDAIAARLAAQPAMVRLDAAAFDLPSGIRIYARAEGLLQVEAGEGWAAPTPAPADLGGIMRSSSGPLAAFTMRSIGPLKGVFRMQCRSEAEQEWSLSSGSITRRVVTNAALARIEVPFTLAAGEIQRVALATGAGGGGPAYSFACMAPAVLMGWATTLPP